MDLEELGYELDEIELFVQTYHRFSAPFIATFNICVLTAMFFDREVRVKVYRRYLLAVQVVLILNSVFLARVQIVLSCEDFAVYMLGTLFGLDALEILMGFAILTIQGQVAVASCLFFRHQQLVNQNGRLHFASRKMHLMILIFNVLFLLSVPVLYLGLKPAIITTDEMTPRLLYLYGNQGRLVIFKRDVDTFLPFVEFSLFQVPYLLIITCLCLHIVYIIVFKDAKMSKQNKRFQLRSLITICLQISFSFLTLAIPFLIGCLGIFRSVTSETPMSSVFRKTVAYSTSFMSSHSFFNSLVLLIAIPSLRKTLYSPIDFILNRGKTDTRTTVVELDH